MMEGRLQQSYCTEIHSAPRMDIWGRLTRVISALRNRHMGNGMTDIFKRRKAYIASSGDFDVCIMIVTNVGAARPTGDH